MNLRDLEYVVAISEYGNMARAAEECHVSQSTLSIQLKKLEEYLGLVIFERNNKRVMATRAGESIINAARVIVNDAIMLKETARKLKDPLAGEFRLGLFPTLAPYLLPKIIPEITSQFPNLTPLLSEEKSPVLLEKLEAGSLDAAILALPVEAASLEYKAIFTDPFLLACHKSHRLSKAKKVTMADLKNETLLLLEDGHCPRDQALEVCYLTGANETKGFRATSLETLRQMVSANVGITLIPKIAATPTPNMIYIPFEKGDEPSRNIGIVWRKTSPQTDLIKQLADIIRKNSSLT